MDQNMQRLLFETLREDIAELKRDVTTIIMRHEQEIDELREFKWRVAGGLAVLVILFEFGAKVVERAFQ